MSLAAVLTPIACDINLPKCPPSLGTVTTTCFVTHMTVATTHSLLISSLLQGPLPLTPLLPLVSLLLLTCFNSCCCHHSPVTLLQDKVVVQDFHCASECTNVVSGCCCVKNESSETGGEVQNVCFQTVCSTCMWSNWITNWKDGHCSLREHLMFCKNCIKQMFGACTLVFTASFVLSQVAC